MKAIVDFVKSNWILLTCGVVTVAAIAAGALGMMSATVVDELNKVKQSANEIATLKNDPQNTDTINAEKERGQKFEEEYTNVVSAAESINQRKPLLDGIFPPRPSSRDLPYRFKEVYEQRLAALPGSMGAGDLPSDQEIRDEEELLTDSAKQKVAEVGAEEPNKPAAGTSGTPPPAGRGPQPPPSGRGGPAGEGAEGRSPLAGVSEEARRRAAAKKARSVRMYAAPKTSFHVSPIARSEGVPEPQEMWFAQMGLWIQEDVAKALARVNEDAAGKRPAKDVNVSTMPIKRLESIRINGYVNAAGSLVPFPLASAGTGGSERLAPAGATFTGRRSDAQFDVVRFTVTVVVDARDVLKLVDAITRQNFYQLVDLDYDAMESDDRGGYLYGEAPLARAVLDFEGYFARRLYKELMPDVVLRDLGAGEAGQKPGAPPPPGRPRGNP